MGTNSSSCFRKPSISETDLIAKSLNYNLNLIDKSGKNIPVDNGFIQVQEAATGMMMIKRNVFEVMKKAYPERKYISDQIVNGKLYQSDNCYDFFAVGLLPGDPDRRYLPEDYYFSRLWRNCGGEVWADITQPLIHYGNMAFRGHVGSLFESATSQQPTESQVKAVNEPAVEEDEKKTTETKEKNSVAKEAKASTDAKAKTTTTHSSRRATKSK